MNYNFRLIIPLYILLFSFATMIKGQEPTLLPIGQDKSVSLRYNPTHKRYYTLRPARLLFIDYEKIWKNDENQKFFRIFRFGVGIGITENFIYPHLTANYNYLFGKNRFFLEFGVGGNFDGSVHLNIGYRLFLGKKFMISMTYQPSTYKLFRFFSGFDDTSPTEFSGFCFGIGYRFHNRWQDVVLNFMYPFTKHISVQTSLFPLSFNRVKEPRPSILLKLAYSIQLGKKQQIEISSGKGILAEGGFLHQIGIGYLIGKRKHFFEIGSNIVFASLRNPNYDYKNSDYKLLQLLLGYRYQFQKLPLFARIAYAPYIRTLNRKREGGLHQNAVLGIGYRFVR